MTTVGAKSPIGPNEILKELATTGFIWDLFFKLVDIHSLSPLSQEEILFLKDPSQRTNLEELLPDIMRRKLLRRTKRQKINLSLKDLENIEKRVASAVVELREAWKFDYVIPTHDGEDSEHWDAFYYPIGDARRALLAFAALLKGEVPAGVEQWEEGLVP